MASSIPWSTTSGVGEALPSVGNVIANLIEKGRRRVRINKALQGGTKGLINLYLSDPQGYSDLPNVIKVLQQQKNQQNLLSAMSQGDWYPSSWSAAKGLSFRRNKPISPIELRKQALQQKAGQLGYEGAKSTRMLTNLPEAFKKYTDIGAPVPALGQAHMNVAKELATDYQNQRTGINAGLGRNVLPELKLPKPPTVEKNKVVTANKILDKQYKEARAILSKPANDTDPQVVKDSRKWAEGIVAQWLKRQKEITAPEAKKKVYTKTSVLANSPQENNKQRAIQMLVNAGFSEEEARQKLGL